jgi:integrase
MKNVEKIELDPGSRRVSGLDVKNRTETGQCSPSKQKSHFGKDDVRYWKQRLKKRSYAASGEKTTIKEWQVRLYAGRREEWFNLETENQSAAAQKARDIYRHLKANGMEDTVATFKPKAVIDAAELVTLGEYFAAVEQHGFLKSQTLYEYVRRTRQITGDILKYRSRSSKYDYVNGGSTKRRKKIDSCKLSYLTEERISLWKQEFVAKAGPSPIERRKREHTCNSCLRNAKALFGKRIIKNLQGIVILPETLPFRNTSYFRQSPFRYRSEVDIGQLLAKARTDLQSDAPELFKIFLLAVFVGLRRKEIDMLTWSAFDWEKKIIRIRASEYHDLKSDASENDVPVESAVMDCFRTHFERSSSSDEASDFVIESWQPPQKSVTYTYYRAEPHFKELLKWLRENGVDSEKPIHTLRKEFGRLITEQHGIFAASKLLRHSSIQVTASHYADDTRHLTTGLGKFLSE